MRLIQTWQIDVRGETDSAPIRMRVTVRRVGQVPELVRMLRRAGCSVVRDRTIQQLTPPVRRIVAVSARRSSPRVSRLIRGGGAA